MAFATAADLSLWVGYDVPADRAGLVLEMAEASVVTAAGVPIAAATGAEATLDGNGAAVLLLPFWPVTAVTTVTVDETAIPDYTWTRAGELRRTAGWARGAVVVVTYDHGFSDTEIPPTIKTVTLEVAARGLANPQSFRAFQTDGTNAQFSSDVLDLTVSERDRVLRALA